MLDNCVPWRLAQHIAGHDVESVIRLGWGTLSDGDLLKAVEGNCDALVTLDKAMPYQQAIGHRPFALIVMRPLSSRLAHLVPIIPELLVAVKTAKPGRVQEIGPLAATSDRRP